MEASEEIPVNERHCLNCNNNIAEETRFCNHCGALQGDHDIDDALLRQRTIALLSVFFGVHLLVCLFANFSPVARGLVPLLIFDGTLSVFTLSYVLYLRKEIAYLFKWNNFSVLKVLGYALVAIALAIVVNYCVKWLNRTIFDTETYYYYAFSHLRYAKLITLLFVALQPAIFEELAFRGVMQEGLKKVVDTRQAIFITAFLFSLLHMSIISFIWMLPFALWLGYVRNKEQTIWYGMLIHFCFNATACFFEFFELHLF